jgi:hypothetical protein
MATQDEHAHFVICIRNEGCEDLELRKLYQVLEDESAERSGFLRIVDESGEDYLYPSDNFLVVDLPPAVEHALTALTASR